jgi:hypothetical protein
MMLKKISRSITGQPILWALPALLLVSCKPIDVSQQRDNASDENAAVIPEARPGVVTDRFAGFALACVHKQYPNKISHVLSGDKDVAAPRDLFPAFYGCFDWHSSVHAIGC